MNGACTRPGSTKHRKKKIRSSTPAPLPSAKASPDNPPRRARGATEDSIAAWNTFENSKTTLLSTSIAATMKICVGVELRTPNQVPAKLSTIRPAKNASHGLRRPPLSAMAPRNGAKTAPMRPA